MKTDEQQTPQPGGTPVERPVGRMAPERACGFPYCGGNAPECAQCLSPVGRPVPARLTFADTCALMPEGVFWGEHLTPQIARELVEAGVSAERKRWEEAKRLTGQMVDPLKTPNVEVKPATTAREET